MRAKGVGRRHLLAMTATHIPRSLALALYGEMTLSVMDEMPPGRMPGDTQVMPPEKRKDAYELVRREVASGRQAFIICPLIDESGTVQGRSATTWFARMRAEG